jgi:hypothetical protein
MYWCAPVSPVNGASFKHGRNSRAITPIQNNFNGSTNNMPYIDIGKRNGLTYGASAASFTGYIRSVEILFRFATDAEIRRIFNFGTAHAAGLITPQDISIDFNQINGQAPICRAGSRQLTVTPYNNTTPDTAGTTYADFYSL